MFPSGTWTLSPHPGLLLRSSALASAPTSPLSKTQSDVPPTGSEHGNHFTCSWFSWFSPGSKRSVSRSMGSEASSWRALVTICFSLDTTEGSGGSVAASGLSELTSKLREYWTEMPPGLWRTAGSEQSSRDGGTRRSLVLHRLFSTFSGLSGLPLQIFVCVNILVSTKQSKVTD